MLRRRDCLSSEDKGDSNRKQGVRIFQKTERSGLAKWARVMKILGRKIFDVMKGEGKEPEPSVVKGQREALWGGVETVAYTEEWVTAALI